MSINFFRKNNLLKKVSDKFVSGSLTIEQYAEDINTTNATVTTVGSDVLYRWTSPGTIGITSQLSSSQNYNSSGYRSTNITAPSPTGPVNRSFTQTGPKRSIGQDSFSDTVSSVSPFPSPSASFSALIIGKGGSVYYDPNWWPGGGAGGMLEGSISLNSGETFNIGVSYHTTISGPFGPTIQADGGGNGGQYVGGSGGSGGGAGHWGNSISPGGSATQTPQPRPNASLTGYGNPGYKTPPTSAWAYNAGGGGAGGGGPVESRSIIGGPGRSNSITGSSITYCIGGSGSQPSGVPTPPASYGCGGTGSRNDGNYTAAAPGVVYLRR